ncbi:MAG: hypothetical protein JRM79_01705 [Nitrososphaerota archaeon]|jgi:hypothetical protein|nr:hypothetical protein [Nitrososphaerota archaeon]MCL5672218.1 hypothetical protein [Nitrososphaerota archaeon]MDG6903540.1 hypothetical protein [Nitrososphaerota archaeon]MDG6912097.1 hypothetical protein [Nitrososphaerota archaeon]MDG6924717.1 hypothetical protein [Nitrososphaerota archaeon]
MASRVPRARYPLFVAGLAIMLFGSLAAYFGNAGVSATGGIVGVGFLLMILSVTIR